MGVSAGQTGSNFQVAFSPKSSRPYLNGTIIHIIFDARLIYAYSSRLTVLYYKQFVGPATLIRGFYSETGIKKRKEKEKKTLLLHTTSFNLGRK